MQLKSVDKVEEISAEDFKKHYPNGYKMEFVSFKEKVDHLGLKEAEKLYDISKKERLEK